jgi:uncharacterized phage-associated protein
VRVVPTGKWPSKARGSTSTAKSEAEPCYAKRIGYCEPMRFKEFDDKRTTQLAAEFLRLRGGAMNYMKLIKLMYIADRTTLGRTGRTISGDIYYSLKHGPILSNTYDLINTDPTLEPTESYWHSHISAPTNYSVSVKQDPGKSELSKFTEAIISEVFQKYGHLNRWTIVDLTHLFPEWEKTNGSARIKIEKILSSLNVPAEVAESIIEDLKAQEAEAALFNS